MKEDADLTEQFETLRRAEVASVPSFERIIGASGRLSRNAEWRVAVAAGILLVAVGWVIHHVPHPPGVPVIRRSEPALAEWRSPTDFLLDTPGSELLHTIPNLGIQTPTGGDPWSPIGMRTKAAGAGTERS